MIYTFTTLRNRPTNSSSDNFIIFEKCPNASRTIYNIIHINDLKVSLIGNDPKLTHIAKLMLTHIVSKWLDIHI